MDAEPPQPRPPCRSSGRSPRSNHEQPQCRPEAGLRCRERCFSAVLASWLWIDEVNKLYIVKLFHLRAAIAEESSDNMKRKRAPATISLRIRGAWPVAKVAHQWHPRSYLLYLLGYAAPPARNGRRYVTAPRNGAIAAAFFGEHLHGGIRRPDCQRLPNAMSGRGSLLQRRSDFRLRCPVLRSCLLRIQ